MKKDKSRESFAVFLAGVFAVRENVLGGVITGRQITRHVEDLLHL